ncbi:hypothetical protein QQ045_013972 [Rhodiola kirilowii]
MHKRFLLALFTLFCVCEAIDGRKELSNYWRSVMKDEDMPEAIKGLVSEDGQQSLGTRFDRKFDPRPNLIIYHLDNHHEHVEPQEVKRATTQNDKKTEHGV